MRNNKCNAIRLCCKMEEKHSGKNVTSKPRKVSNYQDTSNTTQDIDICEYTKRHQATADAVTSLL